MLHSPLKFYTIFILFFSSYSFFKDCFCLQSLQHIYLIRYSRYLEVVPSIVHYAHILYTFVTVVIATMHTYTFSYPSPTSPTQPPSPRAALVAGLRTATDRRREQQLYEQMRVQHQQLVEAQQTNLQQQMELQRLMMEQEYRMWRLQSPPSSPGFDRHSPDRSSLPTHYRTRSGWGPAGAIGYGLGAASQRSSRGLRQRSVSSISTTGRISPIRQPLGPPSIEELRTDAARFNFSDCL